MGDKISELTFKCDDIKTIGSIEDKEPQKAKVPSYEELLILKGRVDAVAAYFRKNSRGYNFIEGEVFAEMLGFDVPAEEGDV